MVHVALYRCIWYMQPDMVHIRGHWLWRIYVRQQFLKSPHIMSLYSTVYEGTDNGEFNYFICVRQCN